MSQKGLSKGKEEDKSKGKEEEKGKGKEEDKCIGKEDDESKDESVLVKTDGGKGKSKGANCPCCSKAVKEKDMALECEICDDWFHIKCQEISVEEYNFLSEHASVHWYCFTCNKNVANVIKLVSSMKLRQEKFEECMIKICEDLSKVTAEAHSNKQSIAAVDKKVEKLVAGNLSQCLIKVIESKVEAAVCKARERKLGLSCRR